MDHNLPLLAVHHLDGGWLWLNASANACPGYIPEERILKEVICKKAFTTNCRWEPSAASQTFRRKKYPRRTSMRSLIFQKKIAS